MESILPVNMEVQLQDYSNEHRTLQEYACKLNGRMSSISKVKRVKSRRVLAESGKKWGVPQR